MTVNMFRALDRHFPEPDTLTHTEWLRREAGLNEPPAAPDLRPRCIVCDRPFTSTKRTMRFCSRPCRRWWHYGVGSAERKAAAA